MDVVANESWSQRVPRGFETGLSQLTVETGLNLTQSAFGH